MPISKKSTPLTNVENEYLKDLFIKKINKASGIFRNGLPDECHIWIGSKEKWGHGLFQLDLCKKLGILKAHRLAMYFFKNEEYMKKEEQNVLHSCDEPSCCNPNHLRMGTDAENVEDMDSRGRRTILKGSSNGFAKFDDDQINQIKELRKSGQTYPQIAERFSCSRRTIERICLGKKGYSEEVIEVNARRNKDEEIKRLILEGKQSREITKLLHTSSTTIAKVRKSMNMD